MEPSLHAPSILGTVPDIGLVCTDLQVLHYYEAGKIRDLANVTYLRLGSAWFRLYFEAAAVFWDQCQPPQAPVNSGMESGLLLNDLSEELRVVGHSFVGAEYRLLDGCTTVTLRWSNGSVVTLEHSHARDSTTIRVES